MRIEIKGDDIRLFGCSEETYLKLRNDFRWNRKDHCFDVVATLSNLEILRHNVAEWPEWLEAKRKKLQKEKQDLDDMRNAEAPPAMFDYPVKKKLFAHQIKGANLAMMIFLKGEEL